MYAESLRLLQEGAADCASLDALMRDAGGFRMGAFELTDLIGHDVNYAVTCSVFQRHASAHPGWRSRRHLPVAGAGFRHRPAALPGCR
ncbi:hypothetical protein I9X38_07515 [Bacillus mojavensis]|nr:hypothetical protein I9X38_07515 [Bacillus mojavensis]